MIGLRLEIGYGGAQPQVYNPATQFGGGGLGLWVDTSDYATQSQDSAGATPVTAAGQTVGRMLDKSGRGNTISQATAAARPLTATAGAILYHTYDGVDDGMATGAATFSADMDCFIAVRRNSAANVLIAYPGAVGATFFGVAASADASAADSNSGTPTYAVNGVSLNGGAVGTTRGQLHTAMPVSSWVVLEIRNLNLATGWTAFALFNYTGFFLNGDFGGMILAPAGDATTRANNRKFLGAKVGLTL